MFIAKTDLDPFTDIAQAKAEAMIEDAEANAILVAPCLVNDEGTGPSETLTDNQLNAVKAVLRAAILRWNDAGSGGVVQQTAGPFSQTVDSRSSKFGRLWPTEIEQLQGVCASATTGKAFSVGQVPTGTSHSDWCTETLGGNYCSCGADIAGFPIYGNNL